MKAAIFLFLLITYIPFVGFSQSARPITPGDYGGWKTIAGENISNNGQWLSFEQNPQRGDGCLVLRKSYSTEIDTFPRGYKAAIGPSSDFLIFQVRHPYDSIRTSKLKKVKAEDIPADSLAIFLFGPKKLYRFPHIKSYQIPEEKGEWVTFLSTPPAKSKVNSDKKNGSNKKDLTGTLVFFKIPDGDTLEFHHVSDWHYAKKGKSVLFVQQLKDSVSQVSKVWSFNGSSGKATPVFEQKGWISKPVMDENGEKYAFLFSADTANIKQYALYTGNLGGTAPEKAVSKGTKGLPNSWFPSENANLWFSHDGTKLYLGTAPLRSVAPKDTLTDDEKAVVDIWHWKDTVLQPQQKVEAEKERNRTYLAVWHVNTKKFVQLADPNVRDITITSKGNLDIALGYDNSQYRLEESWTGRGIRDYYAVDLQTGIKGLMINGKNYARLSPGGKFVAWYDPADSSFYCRSTDPENPAVVSLTKKIPVAFYDEQDDHPADPPPYGIAGWASADRFVYIYDRYDIWRIDPAGIRVPVAVTQTFGRRNELQFRYVKLDKEEEFIPSEPEIILRAFSEKNLTSGFYLADFSSIKEPSLAILDRYNFGIPIKAKEAKLLLWTKENVSTFPDLWFSDIRFTHQQQVTNANPQQEEFIWPEVELVEWQSFAGEPLRGLLFTPDNLNPNKKYPMIIYYYERLSQNMYRYITPKPSQSTVNATSYTSNGYIVFMPDIHYTSGYPGQSAYDAIMSGVGHLIEKYPFIDKDHMGLQGQSWGGYQTAWLITRTDMFAAAMAGAPVSNMTSAYGGIRWETGISRMAQYEKTQSRIGGSLWEKPLQYIENSPLFSAPRIKTPLLMMHNDNDGAVPWYQGIEMFLALRRLHKPVWMLTYNNEPHNLKQDSWGNRMDLDKRMFQFFNHYLKNEPAPEWMQSGVKAIDKGRKSGL